MLRTLAGLWRDEAGLTTVEYAVLLAIIVATSVIAWQHFGQTVSNSGRDSTRSMNLNVSTP
ncbi:MAG: Flp family type IVb pilin [Armatimonadetes bacterium]|nr:Flp family type IVb pilin [Armatimonadota bacterium]